MFTTLQPIATQELRARVWFSWILKIESFPEAFGKFRARSSTVSSTESFTNLLWVGVRFRTCWGAGGCKGQNAELWLANFQFTCQDEYITLMVADSSIWLWIRFDRVSRIRPLHVTYGTFPNTSENYGTISAFNYSNLLPWENKPFGCLLRNFTHRTFAMSYAMLNVTW